MNTDNFFAFIDFVYAFNVHKRTIDALVNGKIRFGRWAEKISKKRRCFESCAFTCYAENANFQKQLPIYFSKLKKTVEGYEKSHWFDKEYNIKTDKRRFLEQKYHEVRRKEIINAYNFLCQLMNDESLNDNHKEATKEKDLLFSNIYNEEQLLNIYQHLITNHYIALDTDKNDFIYYFSGKGELPQNRLNWIGTATDLAIFIHSFYFNEELKWKKTEFVFDKVSNYATVIDRLSSRKKGNPFDDLYDEIKKMKQK